MARNTNKDVRGNHRTFIQEIPIWLWFICIVLFVLIILAISMAIVKGRSVKEQEKAEPIIKVYINQDDSTFINLTKEVEELRQTIDELRNEKLEITVSRIQRE